eukprot:gene28988-34987_t
MEEVRILMPETPLKSSTNADNHAVDVLGQIEFQLLRCREELVLIDAQCQTKRLIESIETFQIHLGDVIRLLERLGQFLSTGLHSASKVDAVLKDGLTHTLEACSPSNIPYVNAACSSRLIVRILYIKVLTNHSELGESNLLYNLLSYNEVAFVAAFHASDWSSNSSFQRNKRISPALLVYCNFISDLAEHIDREARSFLLPLTTGDESTTAHTLVASLTKQVIFNMLQTVLGCYVLELSQLSRVRHWQYRTDLHYCQLCLCSLLHRLVYTTEELLVGLMSPLLPLLALLCLQVHILSMQPDAGNGEDLCNEVLVSLVKDMLSVSTDESSGTLCRDAEVLAGWRNFVKDRAEQWPGVFTEDGVLHEALVKTWKDGADALQLTTSVSSLPPKLLQLALLGFQLVQGDDRNEGEDAQRKSWVGVLVSRRYELLPGDYPALTNEEQRRTLLLHPQDRVFLDLLLALTANLLDLLQQVSASSLNSSSPAHGQSTSSPRLSTSVYLPVLRELESRVKTGEYGAEAEAKGSVATAGDFLLCGCLGVLNCQSLPTIGFAQEFLPLQVPTK